MPKTEPILEYVLRCLDEAPQSQRIISEESGIPFGTLTKIIQRASTNPRIETLQTLHDYFRAKEKKKAA